MQKSNKQAVTLLAIVGAVLFCVAAITLLTVPQGGTGAATFTAHGVLVGQGASALTATTTGTAGQLLVSNGSSLDPTFQDPIVSFNYANLINAQAATGTVAGSAVRLSTLSTYGVMYVTFAGITGSPSGCTVQLKNYDSLANSINTAGAVSVSPANGTTSTAVAPASGLQLAAQMSATYACAVYPSAGTVSVDFVPGHAVGLLGAQSIAVTNTGTFAVQSTLQTQTDTTMVGGFNVKEINGVVPLMGAGNTGTGSPRMTLSTDQAALPAWGLGATGAAPPAGAQLIGGVTSGATGGFMQGIPVCDSYAVVNISTATTTLAITGVASRQVRICSLNLVTAAANNVALIEGTGATCGTGSAGMAGGTTSASGWNFASGGGLTQGSGIGTVMRTATAGDSVCFVTSAATQLSGGISYAIY